MVVVVDIVDVGTVVVETNIVIAKVEVGAVVVVVVKIAFVAVAVGKEMHAEARTSWLQKRWASSH